MDTIHGMTPVHMLAMKNPHAHEDAITTFLDFIMEDVCCLDNQQKTQEVKMVDWL